MYLPWRVALLSLASGLFAPLAVRAQPAHVILIRHAEKDAADPKNNGLSLAGKCRAAALVPYLLESPEMKPLGRPAFVFAQLAANSAKDSLRPVHTVQPV